MPEPILKIEDSKFSAPEKQSIEAALGFATVAHEGQKRKSGEPYVIHPISVANTLMEWGLDAPSVVAALLHDVVEDTPVTLEEIKTKFGPKVAELVDGVTKLGEVDIVIRPGEPGSTTHTENIRKLLLAMTKDLRVIMIKLADRLHNLQTLSYLPPENRVRIATESLEVYAPLADRLGMGQLKSTIEDLSFKYAAPEAYAQVLELMTGYMKEANRYLARLKRFLTDELKSAGIRVVEIEGRQKHLYSVYKKLAKAEGDINKIFDLIAVRVVVPTEADCYQTLGIVHQHFKPLIYRIKDYIAVPKPNGYRSLHTTVLALDGRITEIQIRTPKMHDEAEKGLAAHFYYDTHKQTKGYKKGEASLLPSKLSWVSNLADFSKAATSGQEFIDTLKVDLFQDRIFAFSPHGDLYDLPEGSTPIDFAFAVHSDLGLKTSGAKINGRIVPLDTKLENRDVVEILTRKTPAPNRDWLGFIKTAQARSRIRAWFRAKGADENIASGKSLLETELKAWHLKRVEEITKNRIAALLEDLPYKSLDAVLAAIGEGVLTTGTVIRKLFPPDKSTKPKAVSRAVATGRVQIADAVGLPYNLAPCCKPAYPKPIIGYITRGSGVTIHLRRCTNLPKDEPKRLVKSSWELLGADKLSCRLRIESADRIGILRDLTNVIAAMGININQVKSSSKSGSQAVFELSVEVRDLFELAKLIKKVEQLPGVIGAERVN